MNTFVYKSSIIKQLLGHLSYQAIAFQFIRRKIQWKNKFLLTLFLIFLRTVSVHFCCLSSSCTVSQRTQASLPNNVIKSVCVVGYILSYFKMSFGIRVLLSISSQIPIHPFQIIFNNCFPCCMEQFLNIRCDREIL